jgi:hypothetical protein
MSVRSHLSGESTLHTRADLCSKKGYDMLYQKIKARLALSLITFLIGISILVLFCYAVKSGQPDHVWADNTSSADSRGANADDISIQANGSYTVYLPTVMRLHDGLWRPVWGTQVSDYSVLDKATQAGIAWLRINARWKNIETSDNVYDWSSLDYAITQSVAAELTPMVGIMVNPAWADADGTHCGPLKDNQYLTDFVTDLVTRYKDKVKYWEIGNEVDHMYDESHTQYPDGTIGCWADKVSDYVAFMHTAYDAVKAADPGAKVMLGGLAMLGYSEIDNTNFLRHFLEAGGGPYFDIAAFHFGESHETAWYTCADHDRSPGHVCRSAEGLKGKAQIVQNTLSEEGVSGKTIMLNELGFHCEPCDAARQEEHARWVVKAHARAMSEELPVVIWYTLDYPGFHGSSLLNSDGSPRPAYNVYPVMASELYMMRYKRTIDGADEFGVADLEGYVFELGSLKDKSVMWVNGSTSRLISYPVALVEGGQLRVVDRYGSARLLTDSTDDGTHGDGYISVRVKEPVYVYAYP